MTRRTEIRPVEGLPDILSAFILTTPESRRVLPDRETLERVVQTGNAFIAHAAQQEQHQGVTVYCAYQWPDDGPIHLAFVWAINTRHRTEPATGAPFFFRAYTETQEPAKNLVSEREMEDALAAYAVAHLGRPTPV